MSNFAFFSFFFIAKEMGKKTQNKTKEENTLLCPCHLKVFFYLVTFLPRKFISHFDITFMCLIVFHTFSNELEKKIKKKIEKKEFNSQRTHGIERSLHSDSNSNNNLVSFCCRFFFDFNLK